MHQRDNTILLTFTHSLSLSLSLSIHSHAYAYLTSFDHPFILPRATYSFIRPFTRLLIHYNPGIELSFSILSSSELSHSRFFTCIQLFTLINLPSLLSFIFTPFLFFIYIFGSGWCIRRYFEFLPRVISFSLLSPPPTPF